MIGILFMNSIINKSVTLRTETYRKTTIFVKKTTSYTRWNYLFLDSIDQRFCTPTKQNVVNGQFGFIERKNRSYVGLDIRS